MGRGRPFVCERAFGYLTAEMQEAKMSNVKRIFVDLPEAASLLALSTATLQRLVRTNAFPKPRQLSGRRVGWLLREIEAWAEERPIADLLPPPNSGRNSK